MTVQFSRRAVTALSEGLQSSFADSFVPGTKAAIRMWLWLIDLDDAQLRSGLGLRVETLPPCALVPEQFNFHFFPLIAHRLLQNNERLEMELFQQFRRPQTNQRRGFRGFAKFG